MAKKRKVVKKTASRTKSAKKNLYKAETYGIKFDSMTFLVFSVFVLVAAVLLVSRMIGLKLF